MQVYCLCGSPKSLKWMYINLPLVTRSLFGPLRFYLHFCFTVNTPRWLCSHGRCEVFVSHFPESHSWTHDSSMCNGLSLLCRCEVRMMHDDAVKLSLKPDPRALLENKPATIQHSFSTFISQKMRTIYTQVNHSAEAVLKAAVTKHSADEIDKAQQLSRCQ